MEILIAEDDAVSRRILEKTLKSRGYDVESTENGTEALQAFEKHQHRFAVLDWMMPEIDGVEVCRRIRELDKEKYTYVILLTAKGQKSDVIAGLDAGADDYMIKPFDHDELKSRLSVGERIISLEEKLANQMKKIQDANEVMQRDLNAASQIQQSMLPQKLIDHPRIQTEFRFIPCEKVGGDMLNVFELNNENIGLYISDVSGHGVPAAIFAVAISRILSTIPGHTSICRTKIEGDDNYEIVPPHEVMARLNEQLRIYSRESTVYATTIYGVLNTKTLEFNFVKAGHLPIVGVRSGEGVVYDVKGNLPIGIVEKVKYDSNTIQFSEGDRMYMYSDGIIEVNRKNNPRDEIENLRKTLAGCSTCTLDESLDCVLDSTFSQLGTAHAQDDITLLGLEINSKID